MLFDENSCRGEHDDLLAAENRFEGSSECNFGFAVADIAADKAVHRRCTFHIGQDFVDSPLLIGGFLERKRRLKFAKGGVGWSECTA